MSATHVLRDVDSAIFGLWLSPPSNTEPFLGGSSFTYFSWPWFTFLQPTLFGFFFKKHKGMAKLLHKSEPINRSLLVDAIKGKKDAMLSSLDAGAAVDEMDSSRMTPLMHAAKNGHLDCVRLLIGRGADVHKRSDKGLTAAHYAALGGDIEMLLAILDAGVAVDVTDCSLMTPLLFAACIGHLECLLLLIQRGADVCHPRVDGWTAAHYAADHGNVGMLRVLIASGADLLSVACGHSVVDSALFSSQVDAASFALACGCRFALTRREIEFFLFRREVCGLFAVNYTL